MTYKYLYQTKENENREGTIRARNREAAFHALRLQGIRPYRLIGNDPVNWVPWAVGVTLALLVSGLVWALAAPRGQDDRAPRLRQQIVGDAAFIAESAAGDWAAQLEAPLDRYLAAYAQPGGNAVPPYVDPDRVEELAADLDRPLAYPEGERSEARQLRNIVAYLREEMRAALASGESVADHFAFLEERQREEIALWQKAEQSVLKAPESYRAKMAAGVNAQLRARGIAPVPVGE